MPDTSSAAKAALRARELKEAALWGVCPGCSPLERRVIRVGSQIVMCDHRAWNGYAMTRSCGSLLPPKQTEGAAPEVSFSAE
jgi:hypothetical protein